MKDLFVCIRTAAELALQKEGKDLDGRQLLNLAMKKKSYKLFNNSTELRVDLIEVALKSKLSYFKEEDSQLFVENLKNAEKALKKIQEQNDFPRKDILEEYLNYFFQCCKFLCNNKQLLYQDVNLDNGQVMKVCDYITYSSEDTPFSLYLPYYAEAILTVYYELERLKEYSYIENEFVKQMVISSFTIKAVSGFKRFSIEDKTIFLNEYNSSKKRCCDLSSNVLIQPVCLFKKIQKYASKLNEGELCKVNIIGAVELFLDAKRPNMNGNTDELHAYSPEFLKLCNWLKSNEVTNTHSFQFDVYINRNSMIQYWHNSKKDDVDTFNIDISNAKCIIVKFHYFDYNEISYKNSIDEMMKEKSLLLLLDCSFLYEKYSSVVKDNIVMENFFRFLPEKYESYDFSQRGCICQIYLQLNMFSNYQVIGHFDSILREEIISNIKRQVNTNHNGTEAFIFILSDSPYDLTEFAKKCEHLQERYNNQDFCVLHFDGNERNDLQHNENAFDSSIVFTFWDIISNTDRTLIEHIRQTYNFDHNVIVEEYLSNIFIELMWCNSESFKKVSFSIFNKNEESNKNQIIAKDVEAYLDVIFNNDHKVLCNVFKAMQESFLNIFLNHISDVYQVYSFQKFQYILKCAKKVEIDFCEHNANFQKNIETEPTTLSKFYNDSIANLMRDFPSESLIDIIEYRLSQTSLKPYVVYTRILDVVKDRVKDGDNDNIDKNLYEHVKKVINNLRSG